MELKVINLADKKDYLITVNKTGENQMLCPVCSSDRKNKTAKVFSFNAQKGAGRCNHCQVVLVEKKDFIPKAKEIVYKQPLFKNNTSYSKQVVKFFTDRKIDEKTLLEFKITESNEWMPKAQKEVPAINFNYFRNGELVNIKYRSGGKDFKLFKDAELIFYNLDCSIEYEEIIIVEGEMDCLAMAQSGYKNCVSVPNGAGMGKINFDYLDNCIDSFSDTCKFILAVDNDSAGLHLQNELGRRLGFENCTKVAFKDCKDANDCLIKYGVNGIIESMTDKKEFPIEGVFDANDIQKDIYDYYNNGLPKGCGVDIYELDTHIRFQEGYKTIITGIPGHGKSEFLDFLICKLNIIHGWKFALYSPENHPLELHFSKFAEKVIGKPFEGNNRINPVELDAMIQYHAKNYFFINPKENFSLDNILQTVKSLVRKKGVNAFVIDAWNKLDHHYTTNETKYISEQLDKLSMFCEKQKVHLFLIAHPTKISKDKSTGKFEIPNLYNISGSANFYNKTDNGITVYRNFDENITEIYIQKIKFKHWGKIGCVHMAWDYNNGRYYKGEPDKNSWLSGINKQSALSENTEFTRQPISRTRSEIAQEEELSEAQKMFEEDPF